MPESRSDAASRRPTMADVGRLAGVSAATVSFVLNATGNGRISDATQERVLAAAAALDYRPNRAARGLRLRQTSTLGFVTDEIAVDPFAGSMILGAHEVAWAQESLLLVVNTTRDRRMVRAILDELVHRPVDAILFAVVGTRRITVPDALKGLPAVAINGFVQGALVPSVVPDEVEGGRRAAELLLMQGHRRIAFLAGRSSAWATRARLRGLRLSLAEAGATQQVPVIHGDYTIDSGYRCTLEILTWTPRPTALLCGNDRMALGAYLALARAGIPIPEEMSVVGYDDQAHLAADLEPALTTVRPPYYQMGRWAAEQVLSGRSAELPSRTLLPCATVPRGSVAPPATRPRRPMVRPVAVKSPGDHR